MKIALISAVAIRTPPLAYGGLEKCVYDFAAGLEDLGHDVTLIAAKGSKAPRGVRLVETVESWDSLTEERKQAYSKADGIPREYLGQKWVAHTWNGWRAHEEEAFQMYEAELKGVDVIGDHSWSKWSYTTKKDEIIGTCHSMKPYNLPPPREFPLFVGVSRGHSHLLSQAWQRPVRTAWNPVNVDEFTVQKDKSDRALSFNRIMATKGIHHFVNVINELKVKGDVAGDDSTLVGDQNYVNWIKESCKKSAYLSYFGLVDDKERKRLLMDAKVLVCLKDAGYEEVFGLQAVEALACGTPVVALHSWGFDDTIINGENGFLCDNMEQVKVTLGKIMKGEVKLDPEVCRKSAERFSRKNSSKDYERLFESVKKGNRW